MLPTPAGTANTSPAASVDHKTSAEKSLAAQLEQTILDDCQAVNERNWGPDSPLFYRKAPYWEAEVTAALSLKIMTCNEFVASVKKVTEAHPDYTVRAIDFTTTVHEEAGRAEIFANMETKGLWDGVTQRNVTICEYHRIDGIWYHAAHRTLPGMDAGAGISFT